MDTEQQPSFDSEEYAVSDVPIVRDSTPRPLSFGLVRPTNGQSTGQEGQSEFPLEAPSAPPLPEEPLGTSTDDQSLNTVGATPLPLGGKAMPLEEASSEFIWLFTYGVEMDAAVLNSPACLGGLALLYGPAVLKGYELTFDVIRSRSGAVVATVLPSRQRGAEVWGILYRVPRRLAVRQGEEPALLDKAHFATPPDGLFERLQVVVHEAYRARDIPCITYIASATARNQFHLLPRDQQVPDPSYVERLLESARKQQLPASYIDELAALTANDEALQRVSMLPTRTSPEQNTEPLPVVTKDANAQLPPAVPSPSITPPRPLGLVLFALYLLLMVLAVFVLAVLQGLGFGSDYVMASFTLLGIPWLVLLYGLVGGCLSGIIALGRYQSIAPPSFVLVVWFTRPFVGAVLAALSYLLLNSGIFAFNGTVAQHLSLYSLIAALAGGCEGWLFFRKV